MTETKTDTKGEEFTPQQYISPSSINTFFKCPRSYFYSYITKLRTKPNIHLIKGSIVHKVLEDFFRGYKEGLEAHIKNLFEKTWKKNTVQLKALELPEGELAVAKQDCINMLNDYYTVFTRKVKTLLDVGKAENVAHAYYLLKPKFREIKVSSDELKCRGFIDRVSKDFDGLITLGDYKTSSKYGIGLPEDYKRQLSIYSLLYKIQEKISADFVSVIFLRYGEEYLLEVTPSLLKYARDTITDTYAKTRSTTIEDYPKREGKLCGWCDYFQFCSGEAEWKKSVRLQAIKKALKKEVKDESKSTITPTKTE